MATLLEETYYDPKRAGSYGGVQALVREMKDSNAKEWLSSQDVYTLHKPTRWRFRRRKTFVLGVDHLWQVDLADVSSLSRDNDGHRYILTCIDCFSRYAWAVPTQRKNGSAIVDAFASIVCNRKPTFVQSDKGTEFLNTSFQEFLKANDISFYTSENADIKCALVERFNRTLKTRMWRYFTHTNSIRYLDVLPDLVKSYNDSFHRTIKTAPSNVTIHNENEIRRRLYSHSNASRPKFCLGDNVRISESRRTFKKGYLPGWTRESFKIVEVVPTDPLTYRVTDYSGEPVTGKFYAEELQKVIIKDNVFKVERIVKTRKRHGKTEYLVRWLGYPSKFDSWVDNILM